MVFLGTQHKIRYTQNLEYAHNLISSWFATSLAVCISTLLAEKFEKLRKMLMGW